jgi:hypothetical protein
MPLDVLRAIAQGFEQRRVIVARKCVYSMTAPAAPDERIICEPGDEITVERWYWYCGAVVIRVNPVAPPRRARNTCIPWSWLIECQPVVREVNGLRPIGELELASYMPIAPFSWEEIIEAKEKGVQPGG